MSSFSVIFVSVSFNFSFNSDAILSKLFSAPFILSVNHSKLVSVPNRLILVVASSLLLTLTCRTNFSKLVLISNKNSPLTLCLALGLS